MTPHRELLGIAAFATLAIFSLQLLFWLLQSFLAFLRFGNNCKTQEWLSTSWYHFGRKNSELNLILPVTCMCLIHWERYSATKKPFQDIGVMDSETVCGNRCWLLLLSIITTSSATTNSAPPISAPISDPALTLFCNNGFCCSFSQFAITVPGRAPWSPSPEWSF